jgi:hypothetical protein
MLRSLSIAFRDEEKPPIQISRERRVWYEAERTTRS